jgi:TRAP-type C4-dicarboxylate transport system substrate-binding protein
MKLATLVSTLVLGALLAPASHAQTPMRALGNFQNQLQSSEIEKPFFLNLGKATNSMFDVQFRTMDEVGLRGFDGVRLLKLGVFDVMAVQLGYVSGDDPFLLGIDLPGVAPDLATARKVVEAYRGAFAKRVLEKYNGHTVALWPYPGQIFFCRSQVGGLDELKGKKVRTFTPAMAKFVEYFGGIPVTLAFPEVYEGLQRGVVDCAISGSLSGNTSKWFEVSSFLYPLNIGWGIQAHVVNNDYWRKLSPAQRDALTAQFRKMESDLWDLADRTTQDGVNCNTSTGQCKYGTAAKMQLVAVKDADGRRMREAAEKVVVPAWIADCTKTFAGCSQVWSETVGKVVGIAAK